MVVFLLQKMQVQFAKQRVRLCKKAVDSAQLQFKRGIFSGSCDTQGNGRIASQLVDILKQFLPWSVF